MLGLTGWSQDVNFAISTSSLSAFELAVRLDASRAPPTILPIRQYPLKLLWFFLLLQGDLLPTCFLLSGILEKTQIRDYLSLTHHFPDRAMRTKVPAYTLSISLKREEPVLLITSML